MEPDNREQEPVFTIDRPVPGDAREIAMLRARVWVATYANEELGFTEDGIRNWVEGEHGEKIEGRAKRLESQFSALSEMSPELMPIVARVGGHVVGYATPFIEQGGKARVGGINILPGYQGMGIGTKLLSAVLEQYGDNRDVFLRVVTYNTRAQEFYRKHGFVESGETIMDDKILINGTPIPEIEMVRKGVVRE